MALAKSIKMYLTIFVATTCIYMVLYQYHLTRQPLTRAEILKQHKDFAAVNIVAVPVQHSDQLRLQPEQQQLSLGEEGQSTWQSLKYFLWPIENRPARAALIDNGIAAPAVLNENNNSKRRSLATIINGNATRAASAHSNENGIATTTTTAAVITRTNTTHALQQQQQQQQQHAIPTATASTTTTTTTTIVAPVNTKTEKPPLYIITPTYRRPEQLAELTRLGYTLKHIVNLLWLVIEDANTTSALVMQTLNRIGVPYEYLVAPMPEEYKKTKKAKPRGVSNRNRGLAWLRANATEGVFYFADDDNTYDISIFEQMRYTKKVSMWPVGLVTKFGVSSPIVRNGKIDGFYDGWIGGRKYPVDMAGFAVSVKFLHERPKAKMPYKPGYEEDGFLKSLAPLNNTEIELLAGGCTEILTWHTQTKKNAAAVALNMTKYSNTNLLAIDKSLVRP